jgi:ATP-binding cassette subfamily B protein
MYELRRLISFARPYWKNFLVGIISLILCDLFQLFIPATFKKILDSLISPGAAGYTSSQLMFDSLKILAFAVAMFFFRWAWRRKIMISSRAIERDVRHSFFDKLLKLSSSWFDSARTGDIMARATSDVMAIERLSGVAVFSTIDAVFLCIFSLYFMFSLDPWLTLVAIIPLPLISLYVVRIGKQIHKKADAAQAAFGEMSSSVQETFSGIRVIKDFGQEKAQEEIFGKISENYLKRNLTLALYSNSSRPVMHFIIEVSFALTILYGGWRVIENTLSFGAVIAFMAYLDILIWPVIAIGWVINLFHRGLASMARIGKILDTEEEIVDGDLDSVWSADESSEFAISIRNLSFSYSRALTGDAVIEDVITGDDAVTEDVITGDDAVTEDVISSNDDVVDSPSNYDVLSNISLDIPWGSTLGVVGTTGSGKSTLIKLLLREYEAPEGTVFVNGHSVTRYKQSALRRLFSVVPQDALLFSGEIKKNILFGIDSPDGDDYKEKMERAASIAGLTSEIEDVFPLGFDTIVGVKGLALSGGQRQRMAIARALVLERPVIIFDDCLSAVDTQTEENILSAIKDVVSEATSIIVSNRLSSLRYANQIVVMDNGRIVQQGDHATLLNEDGLYSDLFRRQQIEHSIEEVD